jgi:hypothetical protein
VSSAPQSRKTFKLSDSLNRQLNTYALVASAAGVSVLALARASEAKVIYTETHQVTRARVPLYIDLNHDVIKDFVLRTRYYAGSYFSAGSTHPDTATSTTRSPGDVLVAAAIFFLLPPLCPQALESDQNANSPFSTHLWQWSFSTVSTPASIPT